MSKEWEIVSGICLVVMAASIAAIASCFIYFSVLT